MTTKAKQGNQKQVPKEIQDAIDYGTDINQLFANLKRTPAERIRRHQIALNTVKMLQRAKIIKTQ